MHVLVRAVAVYTETALNAHNHCVVQLTGVSPQITTPFSMTCILKIEKNIICKKLESQFFSLFKTHVLKFVLSALNCFECSKLFKSSTETCTSNNTQSTQLLRSSTHCSFTEYCHTTFENMHLEN